jgi:hypothetical protein
MSYRRVYGIWWGQYRMNEQLPLLKSQQITLGQLESFLWGAADILRGKSRQSRTNRTAVLVS